MSKVTVFGFKHESGPGNLTVNEIKDKINKDFGYKVKVTYTKDRSIFTSDIATSIQLEKAVTDGFGSEASSYHIVSG